MDEKVNIRNSRVKDSNIVVDSPKTTVANVRKETKNKKSWQNNIFLYVLVGIVIILIGSYLSFKFWGNKMEEKNTKPKINLENSSVEKSNLVVDSPNSVNIVGDNNVVNKLDIPEPQFKGTYQSQNMIDGNLYQTNIILDILSQVPLQRIQIGVVDSNIVSIDARKNSMVSAMQGIMQSSGEGQAFISFENAFGSYVVTIDTKKPDPDLLSKIKISYQ